LVFIHGPILRRRHARVFTRRAALPLLRAGPRDISSASRQNVIVS
jgi:hypothetical protein